MKRPKYGNRKVTVDGLNFDSQREATLFMQYRMLEKAGQITHLEQHPVYKLVVNGAKVGRITPDFQFRELDGTLKVYDVKSPATAKTEAFRLRKRVFEALYPGVVIEVVY
jgi:hypothetical protein